MPTSRTTAATIAIVVLVGCLTAELARSTVKGIIELGMFPQDAVVMTGWVRPVSRG